MTQLPLFFALQVLGSWAWLAFGPRRELGLGMAMGFLTGLALAVFLSFPLLLLGCFNTATVVGILALALAALVWLAVRREPVPTGTVLRLLAWAVGFTALCIPFCVWNTAVMTYDSHRLVFYAQVLQDEERLTLQTTADLYAWGSFQVVAHALSVVTREHLLYALPPAFSMSLLATFAVALYRGLDELGVSSRRAAISVAVVLLILLAIPLVRQHTHYVHANWTAAGYLFVFGAVFWLADVKNDPAYLPTAFLALLAFSFGRVEGPAFTAVFLALTLSQTRHARSTMLVPYLCFTLVLTAWLLLLSACVPDESMFLSTQRCLLMAAAVVGIFGAFLIRGAGFMQRLLPWVPPLVGIGCLIGIAFVVATRFDVFEKSFGTWQRDLWLGSFWGYFLWPLVSLLAVLTFLVPAPPSSRPLRDGSLLFFALVTMLAAFSDEFSHGRYGGLTRVTLHVVPLLLFYFALVFAPALSRRRSTG